MFQGMFKKTTKAAKEGQPQVCCGLLPLTVLHISSFFVFFLSY